jgi:hypothetical protein
MSAFMLLLDIPLSDTMPYQITSLVQAEVFVFVDCEQLMIRIDKRQVVAPSLIALAANTQRPKYCMRHY